MPARPRFSCTAIRDPPATGATLCAAWASLGGPWGLAWATANPQAIASVSCINTGVLSGYRWHYLARIWQTPVLGELFMATTTKAGMRMLLRHGNPRGLLKVSRNTLDTKDAMQQLSDALRPLDLPALVVWGAHDPYIGVEFAERQRQVFPRAEVKILRDSGHWPFADDPDAVAQVVVPFLRRQLQHH